jgi:hypothetical protein
MWMAASEGSCSSVAAGYRVKGVNEAVEAEKSIKLSKLPQVMLRACLLAPLCAICG